MINANHVLITVIFWLVLSMREGTDPTVAFVGAGIVALFSYFWCKIVDWVWP